MARLLSLLVPIVFLGSVELRAQDIAAPATRAEEITDQQIDKAQSLTPAEPGKGEHRFEEGEKEAHHIFQDDTIHVQLGGLPMESGFSFGPTMQIQSRNDRVRGSLWAIGSFSQFYSVGTGLELPRLTSQRFDLKLEAAHLDLPQLDFYGEGPDSLKSQRTDYRREDTRFDLMLAWPALTHLTPNCKAEELLLNVGHGINSRVTSTELKFTPDEAPGLDVQHNYFIGQCGVRLNYLDASEYPHEGTLISANFKRYVAEGDSRQSFNRATAEAAEYIPFLNQKRVIALHAATDMTFHSANQVEPFYLQPTLGGFYDLRGFRSLRFYDENSAVFNAEYRWEICTGFDMALFSDTGEVFHRPSQFKLDELQESYGFGFRFNNRGTTAMRIDTGFSREGFQIWVAFKKAF